MDVAREGRINETASHSLCLHLLSFPPQATDSPDSSGEEWREDRREGGREGDKQCEIDKERKTRRKSLSANSEACGLAV